MDKHILPSYTWKKLKPDKIIQAAIPEPNLMLGMGDNDIVRIELPVKRTIYNRFRYWMLCKFFPFHIMKWDA